MNYLLMDELHEELHSELTGELSRVLMAHVHLTMRSIRDPLNCPEYMFLKNPTPLHTACKFGNSKIVQLLLRDPRIVPDFLEQFSSYLKAAMLNESTETTKATIIALITAAFRREKFFLQDFAASSKIFYESVTQSDGPAAPKLSARSFSWIRTQLTPTEITELTTLMGDDLGLAQIQVEIEATLKQKRKLVKMPVKNPILQNGLAQLPPEVQRLIAGFVDSTYTFSCPEDSATATSIAHAGGGAAAASGAEEPHAGGGAVAASAKRYFKPMLLFTGLAGLAWLWWQEQQKTVPQYGSLNSTMFPPTDQCPLFANAAQTADYTAAPSAASLGFDFFT
jgi:hypothetical protein